MQLFYLITGPVGKVLGLILLMSVFGLGLGTMNAWYLQTVDAGVINNERFDRVVLKGSHGTADDAWAAVTGTETNPTLNYPTTTGEANALRPSQHNPTNHKALRVVKEDGECKAYTSGQVSSNNHFIASETAYTPIGTEVTIDGVSNGTVTGTASRKPAKVIGCEWQEESKIFKQAGMGGLIAIVLQAVGLAGPVLLLTEVGTFASSFARRAGGNPILSIVITLIVLLLVGTMMQTFVPFLSDAFEAIDSQRFLMYDSGLGKLATVISSFLGVVLVAGLLMLGWSLWQNLRGGNLLGGAGQRM